MLGAVAATVGVVATIALAATAVIGRALTAAAGAVAAVFGIAIVLVAGFSFLALLVVFVVVTSLATRYRFAEKARRHVQEGRAGERGVSNVLAHIVLPTAIALLGGSGVLPFEESALLFASALAFAMADTLASEFGVLTGRAVSILTFREVTPGTNGGISSAGQLFAVAGSLGMALVGGAIFALFSAPIGPPAEFLVGVGVAGFLGCQVDSVLGETLENRGYLTKGSTNFLGMLVTLGLALGIGRAVGGLP